MAAAEAGPPARSRGVIALEPDKCTVCMICVRECPVWCITIDSHTEYSEAPASRPTNEPETPSSAGARGRARPIYMLDRFDIDYGLCMYCGICVETCPFDALHWAADYDYASESRAGLVQDRDVLATWNGTPGSDV